MSHQIKSICFAAMLAAPVLVSNGAVAAESSLCPAAINIVGDLACVESARGVALAQDATRAQRLLDLAEGGASRFESYFDIEPLRYAVVEQPDAVLSNDKIVTLRKSGYPVVLAWLSEAVFRQQSEASIRRAVTAQMAGRSAEEIEAAVQAGMARQMDPARRARIELAAVPHELGHDWFRIGYWPGAPLGENKHYGGPSPDWLDEMSAVLLEAPEMFAERITQFEQRYAKYRANPAGADEGTRLLLDLKNFMTETHPAFDQVRLLNAMQSDEEKKSTVRVLTGDEARKIAEGGVRFYLQSAVASEYLIDRTGDQQIFGRIARAFVRGETIEQWLAGAEPKGTLPRDLDALQADWMAWLEKRFPSG